MLLFILELFLFFSLKKVFFQQIFIFEIFIKNINSKKNISPIMEVGLGPWEQDEQIKLICDDWKNIEFCKLKTK